MKINFKKIILAALFVVGIAVGYFFNIGKTNALTDEERTKINNTQLPAVTTNPRPGDPTGGGTAYDTRTKNSTPTKVDPSTVPLQEPGVFYSAPSNETTNVRQPSLGGANATGIVPGKADAETSKGLVKCGKAEQRMCTLCDLISGLNTIIVYLRNIVLVVALTSIVVAGIMYIVSFGEQKLIGNAKTIIKNALIGVIVMLAAWLIVNSTIRILGAKTDLGIRVQSWDTFICQ